MSNNENLKHKVKQLHYEALKKNEWEFRRMHILNQNLEAGPKALSQPEMQFLLSISEAKSKYWHREILSLQN